MRYTLTTPLSESEAFERIGALLEHESVEFRREGRALVSTFIPFVVANFDSRLYTRRNRIGVNPFIAFDKLRVEVTGRESGSLVEINLGWERIIVTLSIIIGCIAMIAFFVPYVVLSVLVVLVIGGAAASITLGMNLLVRNEIRRAIDGEKAPAGGRASS